ncbi:MAG: peptidylprolyl isomerase [Desulfocapsaceae bacterium]|nr:peptidylprolyl isomerase [Desulfocapsaceae bacterium]
MAAAKKGDTVKIHYTGTLADGTTFDSSAGHDPLSFQIGGEQVIAGFEEAVLGMSVGESKTVTIPAEKAYGAYDEALIIKAPREHIPPDLDPQVGQRLQMGGPGGELVQVVVTEIGPSHVSLDANPPLAGKDLTFQIELVAIG